MSRFETDFLTALIFYITQCFYVANEFRGDSIEKPGNIGNNTNEGGDHG